MRWWRWLISWRLQLPWYWEIYDYDPSEVRLRSDRLQTLEELLKSDPALAEEILQWGSVQMRRLGDRIVCDRLCPSSRPPDPAATEPKYKSKVLRRVRRRFFRRHWR